MTRTASDFVSEAEQGIKTGTKQEALNYLQALGFYVSYGVITKDHYNRLRKVIRTRFPE